MNLPLYEYILFISLTSLLVVHTTLRGLKIQKLQAENKDIMERKGALYAELQVLKSKPPPPREHSLELTEFLADTKKYGYGFVRVDPASVIQRSPRGDIP